MKNVFIDSNIWLSLFHFTNDDLEQFSKLKVLNEKDIRIFIPSQTRNEVQRNRDAKIKDSLSKFEKLDLSFPAFCKNYEEYSSFSRDFNELKRRHKAWCEKIHSDISNQELPADKVIKDFFDSCPDIECTPDNIRDAELRYKAGNPPGKDNKLGDAINWECLLSAVPDGEDLFFISADKDYRSVIDDDSFNLFLKEEWKRKKNSEIHFFSSLVLFLKAHVKEIKLLTEQKKDELINGLYESPNFQTTHAMIRLLNEYNEWSMQQVDDMCSAALTNHQVEWILGDLDVLAFYEKLLSSTKDTSHNTEEVRKRLNEIKQEKEDESEELPF